MFFWVACSNSKDSVVNRTYHQATSKYNILFNGYESLERARQEIVFKYKDDFNELLPLEPFSIGMPAMNAQADLDNASEKAAKTIQRHTMEIKGAERNKQINDAYFLLGMARFYQAKYLPALEAFNFVKINFRGQKRWYDARIWAAKCDIREGNLLGALEALQSLKKDRNLPERLYEELYRTMADAQIRNEDYAAATASLDFAIKYSKKKFYKVRYHYIKAQLYRLGGRLRKSSELFDQVVSLRPDYEFVINARIDKARNYDPEEDDPTPFITGLKKLAKDERNQNWLDQIYYQMGEIEYLNASYDKAIGHYRQSLAYTRGMKSKKGRAYERLGDAYFEKSQYIVSGEYYDSTFKAIDKSYKNYYGVKKKLESLEGVIRFANMAASADSVLSLVAMDDDERKKYFSEQIRIREKEEEKRRELLAEQSVADPLLSNYSSSSRADAWYFYNKKLKDYGKQEFEDTWGERSLQDYWRLSSRVSVLTAENSGRDKPLNSPASIERDDEGLEQRLAAQRAEQIKVWMDSIPRQPKEIERLVQQRDYANYTLGLLYKEQFGKYEKAAEQLENLLLDQPQDKIKLPTHYYLYRIYEQLGYRSRISQHKEVVINDYPDSKYAQLILDPGAYRDIKDIDDPLSYYEQTYRLFTAGDYKVVIERANKFLDENIGNPLSAKMDFLKALSRGKLYGQGALESALNYVIFTYPNYEESKKARKLITEIRSSKKRNPQNMYRFSPNTEQYVVVQGGIDLQTAKQLKKDRLYLFEEVTSERVELDNTVMIIFKSFENHDEASEVMRRLLLDRTLRQQESSGISKLFIISRPNYERLLMKGSLEEYHSAMKMKSN